MLVIFDEVCENWPFVVDSLGQETLTATAAIPKSPNKIPKEHLVHSKPILALRRSLPHLILNQKKQVLEQVNETNNAYGTSTHAIYVLTRFGPTSNLTLWDLGRTARLELGHQREFES